MDKELNEQLEVIGKTIDIVAKKDRETTQTLETILVGLKKWGCQGADFMQIRDELTALAQKHQRSRDEAREMKEERKLYRKSLDEKVVNIRKEIEELQTSNHQIQDQINNPDQLPLVLKLMRGTND